MHVNSFRFGLLTLWVLFTCAHSSFVIGDELVCDNFELSDSVGETLSLADVKTPYKVIVFLGTECPLAKLYAHRLNELTAEFADAVTFLGINSNCQDSKAEIAAYTIRQDVSFPILKDLQNRVADQLSAERTPEVFLLDETNSVRYRGRIDDQYGVGYARSKPTRSDLREAIRELLAGKEVSVPKTIPVGCHIGRLPAVTGDDDVRRPADENLPSDERRNAGTRGFTPRSIGEYSSADRLTYGEHVAPILRRHCVECHRKGEIAPFALTSYDEVVGWGETIREVIENRRMPPWHAHPEYGEFINAREMKRTEVQTVFRWIDNGMPKGDVSSLPELPDSFPGWRLPAEPDMVIPMSETGFDVPAEGTVEYQYFVVDPQLKEDRWVSGAEVVPGNREVVHHVIVFVRPPHGERQDGIGWLAAYVPGQSMMLLPDGMARRVPAGSKLVFQLHYTPTGRAEKDVTKVGLLFADPGGVNTEVQTRIVIDRDFEIPPFAEDYAVTMSAKDFPPDSRLLAIVPHMHYRGARFRVSAESDDSTKILLDVPNYDFNWQHAYELKESLPLAGVRIDCTATFDNSESNLANPDPSATVRWGDQTWEEMALAYLAIAIPLTTGKTNSLRTDQLIADNEPKTIDDADARERNAQEIARQFFSRLDANNDREILRAETPTTFRAFAFRTFDTNQDEKLTWEEVLRQARLSQRPQ